MDIGKVIKITNWCSAEARRHLQPTGYDASRNKNQMGKIYTITDEDNVPKELTDALENGETIQTLSSIGMIDLDEPEFRCDVDYHIKGSK